MLPAALHILASDFSGIIAWLLGIPVLFVALAALSFIAAARGHWVGPVIAGPAVVVGLLLFWLSVAGHAPFGFVMLSGLPAVLGILSIGVFAERRRR